jgi:hypothetical protein
VSEPQFDASAYGSTQTDPQAPDPVNGDTAVSLDDLHQFALDADKSAEVARSGLVPAGTYQTDPAKNGPMNVLVNQFEEKDDAGNVTGTRLMVTFTGRGEARVKIGNDIVNQTGGLRVRLSPQYRKKLDFDTREELASYDMASRLWQNAESAFKQAFGEAPKNAGQVVEYLRDYSVRFRQIQVGVPTKSNPTPNGEPGNMVVAISPVRTRK